MAGERRKIQVLPSVAARIVGGSSIDSKTTTGKVAAFMTGYPHREWLQFADSFKGLYDAMKEGDYEEREKDIQRLLMGPVGIIANVLAYNYLRQMQYAITNLLSADDDEEKEKAQEEMDRLLSARGVFGELGAGLASLGASKYSGAGRQLLKAAGSLAYNMTDDSTDDGRVARAEIRALVRNLTFQDPYAVPEGKWMVREGMYKTVGESIPPLATAIDNWTRVVMTGHDFDDMRKRLEAGQSLEKEEQEAVVVLAFGVNVLNALGQYVGLAVVCSGSRLKNWPPLFAPAAF